MIDVLLATYNGEKHLLELLTSLRRQRYDEWRIIVRDDGSTDETLSLIEAWSKENPGKVHVLKDGQTRLGACGNFAALLEASKAPYFMFCDQDDVWLYEQSLSRPVTPTDIGQTLVKDLRGGRCDQTYGPRTGE